MLLLQNYASYSDVARVGEPGQETFPPSCSGWLWVTSPGTARALATAATQVNSQLNCRIEPIINGRVQLLSHQAKFLWVDDVWITGYLAQRLSIQHLAKTQTAWHMFLICFADMMKCSRTS